MSISRRAAALAGSAAVIAAGLTLAVAVPSSSSDDIGCDAEFASLVIRNGQNQYFECADSGGTLRQGLASKNPWVLNTSPALFTTPQAQPSGAVGQVFTGAVQGAGVISSSDVTGSERDSISRDEVLIIERDKLQPSFGKLDLQVKVLQPGTTIKVEAIGPFTDQSDTDEVGPLGAGERVASFFSDEGEQVFADGFRISAPTGEFQLLGKGGTRFYFFEFSKVCDINSGESCELTFGTTTLRATNVDSQPVDVRIDLDPNGTDCGSVTPLVASGDYRLFEVFCERVIDYTNELPGEVDLDENGSFNDLKDCAVDGVNPNGNAKDACILSLRWTSAADGGQGKRQFESLNLLDSDPRYR